MNKEVFFFLKRNDELMHYGVPGMKWGHRKAAPTTSVDRAKANYRAARKTYNRSFNKAANDAKILKEAKSVYKAEKKQFKSDVERYRKSKGVYDLNVNKNGAVIATSKASKVKKSISAKKGKTYADKVAKTADKKDLRLFVTQFTAIGVGFATSAYLINR